MATRTKTTRWAWPTLLTDLATNTTLGTATRHDFAAKTIYMPETTRTIKSVIVKLTLTDAHTAATDYDGIRVGIKINAVAFNDVDTTLTAANTGEQESLHWQRDVTSYFVTNDPGTSSFTVQVGVAVATGVASNVRNITCELFVTYEYSDAASTQIKTVLIPLQSGETDLATTYSEVGSAGTGPAPANQIPQLTGGGGLLPEASVTIRDQYIVILANDYGQPAVTDFNMFVRLDGSTELTRATVEKALQTATGYQDIIDSSLMPSTGAAHAFELRSSLADRFFAPGGFMVVTYEFSPGSSTTILNSIVIPLENELSDLIDNPQSADPARYVARFAVMEPATIALKQSGVVLSTTIVGNSVNTFNAQAQTGRSYTGVAGQIVESTIPIVHRCDHSSSNWSASLVRGKNALAFEYSTAANVERPMSGYAIVNYTSGKAAAGVGAHNQSTWWFQKTYEGTPVNDVVITPTAPAIPETMFHVSGVLVEAKTRLNQVDMALMAERETGEDSGAGWYGVSQHQTAMSAEIGTKIFYAPCTKWFRARASDVVGANVETARDWRFSVLNAGQTASFAALLCMTHHGITFVVDGQVNSDGSPLSGVAIRAYEFAGSFAGTDTTDGAGDFSIDVLDDTLTYLAYLSDGGDIGASATGLPGAGHDITIFSGGGGGAPPITPPAPGPSTGVGQTGRVFGLFDTEIDPLTRDYIDTDDGSWSETEDSRTAVMMQLEIRYGSWHADPTAGSRIRELLESGEPVTEDVMLDETRRALQLLVDEGIIAELTVGIGQLDSSFGKLALEIAYRDRASGRPVDMVYSPFGG